MEKLNKCTESMAWYLYKKWRAGDITQSFIEKLFTFECSCVVMGGWFADFYYDSLMD